ncbi:MAG: transposase [Polyangiaceae bacterium]|nr:transposase [Polyangiaceae bacterium]
MARSSNGSTPRRGGEATGPRSSRRCCSSRTAPRFSWSLQQEFFPDADVCLDWFHVVEKLWKAGKAICRRHSARAPAP